MLLFIMKLHMTPIMLTVDNTPIVNSDILYFLLISTKVPKQADPIMPPTIKIAPNKEAASYIVWLMLLRY